MGSVLWQLIDRTSETEFIFALFHFLLAGLALLVMLRWAGRSALQPKPPAPLLLTLGFSLFALDFALTTIYYGTAFFFDRLWDRLLYVRFSGALAGCAILLSSAGLAASIRNHWPRWATRCTAGGCLVIASLLILDLTLPAGSRIGSVGFPLLAPAITDVLVVVTVTAAVGLLLETTQKWRQPAVLALLFLLSSTVMHLVQLFWNSMWSNLLWHSEEHLLSFSLVAFAWALGERSAYLFDRVFVRLNLSFILLASIMILSTIGMERIQYTQLAEERSLSLAEYLRGYVAFYGSRGEDLEAILNRSDVLRRIVVGFGELPDFQRIEIFLGGSHAVFRYASDKTIDRQIGRFTASSAQPDWIAANDDVTARKYFRMIRMPVYPEHENGDRIEFYAGMQYINRHIGSYIVMIYLLFTVMVTTSIAVVGIIVRNADLSIQKQHAEIEGISRQLLQAAKLASIGELAGGVAHEINNPVTGILCTATHLIDKRRDTSLTERDKQQLELIAEQAERISDIVTKLLTFSRQSRMEMALCDVNAVIEKAISLIEFRLKNTPVILRRELKTGLPPVLCDANRLTEVFVNLMNNAMDAMHSAGTLTVQTGQSANGHVQVAVTDTGEGIAPAVLQRIFDPFFTTKAPGKGTGLGLSISHGVVRGHHGEIRVQSAPGQGSTFTVVLPVGAS